ncbi:plasmid stabilization protein [Mesorhizobium sp. CN2-181]|uniref:plasmid stabilization protein n=1 Tax=Mesorhizobium yinganensis TaxID=3157707 RepID=UPI0032B83F48
MTEPRLSVVGAKARDLTPRLAQWEKCSIASRKPAASFYLGISNDHGTDIDLEVVIQDTRSVNPGPDF